MYLYIYVAVQYSEKTGAVGMCLITFVVYCYARIWATYESIHWMIQLWHVVEWIGRGS